MRKVFFETLSELAELDPRIVLLTGDLGYTVLEPFRDRYPDRFFNVGVAEQNMIGMATGLAEAGFIPFAYSIIPFVVLRPYEFIRNGPVLHGLPVRIVGVGTGFDYGYQGLTHWGLEDIGLMRMQPNMTVVAPSDSRQTRNVLQSTWNLAGPVYYSIGKSNDTQIKGLEGRFGLDQVYPIREGADMLFIATGAIVQEALAAAEILHQKGVESTVVVVSTLNPPPVASLIPYLSCISRVITVEAHYITGGLGSLVSEIVADSGLGCKVVRCGVKMLPAGVNGSRDYLYERYGLSSRRLVETALQTLEEE